MQTKKQIQAGERTLKFDASKFEVGIINQIANRAVAMANNYGVAYDKMTAFMDIDACHSSGMPLQLGALLEADEANFAHDVFGIRRHINRRTGQIEGCFVPRFAMPD